jgi:hypothetical protein
MVFRSPLSNPYHVLSAVVDYSDDSVYEDPDRDWGVKGISPPPANFLVFSRLSGRSSRSSTFSSSPLQRGLCYKQAPVDRRLRRLRGRRSDGHLLACGLDRAREIDWRAEPAQGLLYGS